jgi:hypothetical protein
MEAFLEANPCRFGWTAGFYGMKTAHVLHLVDKILRNGTENEDERQFLIGFNEGRRDRSMRERLAA